MRVSNLLKFTKPVSNKIGTWTQICLILKPTLSRKAQPPEAARASSQEPSNRDRLYSEISIRVNTKRPRKCRWQFPSSCCSHTPSTPCSECSPSPPALCSRLSPLTYFERIPNREGNGANGGLLPNKMNANCYFSKDQNTSEKSKKTNPPQKMSGIFFSPKRQREKCC